MSHNLFRKFILLFAVFSFSTVFSQYEHVKWKFSQKKLNATDYELSFTASIDPGWHLYSQIETADVIVKKDGARLEIRILEDGDQLVRYRKLNDANAPEQSLKKEGVDKIIYAEGPAPTGFKYEKSAAFQLLGKTIEPKPHEAKEPMFDDIIVRSFEGKVVFTQKIKILKPGTIAVKGFITGQTCNDSQCQQFSPPIDFEFKVTDAEVAASSVPDSSAGTAVTETLQPSTDVLPSQELGTKEMAFEEAPAKKEDKTYMGLFIAGFLGGLLALLTPCVFPMIPMTVSFFIKQSKTKLKGIRNAIIYAASIIIIYIILGLGVTLIFGADAVNSMATNVWFNLAFFVLLVIFAISFLGAFEITLPASFVNKMDAKSDRGGLIGIFFMAFTLALVSFSCTGPIVGTLLVQAAATGALAGPFFGMLGFSMALALPFGLFAAFPGWLNSLPKSGGWLNSVKVVLGFLELALALKFLSTADLVVQAHLLEREVFLVLWIAIFTLLGAYLMGWFRLPHDSELKSLPVGRVLFAVIVFAFVFYLIPGLFGAPLKLISGFPPPDFYSESPEGFGGKKTIAASSNSDKDRPENAHAGPHGIPAFDDYYKALEYAKEHHKPLMLDFTGWGCVNCRKMENQVWIDPDVKKRLSEDFVLVSLYVDDKKTLPENLQKEVVWHGSNRKLRSIGDRWMYLQQTKYNSSAQPQYWIIDADEKLYSDAASYDPDVRLYLNWLDKGMAAFKKDNP